MLTQQKLLYTLLTGCQEENCTNKLMFFRDDFYDIIQIDMKLEVVLLSLRFDLYMDEKEATQMNALQLAFLGDSVWDLINRYILVNEKYNVRHMHQKCVEKVNAHAQSQYLISIEDMLTEKEKDIVRRGKNSHPKHSAPRNQTPDEYSSATGFEALFGFLYLTGQNERICSLVNHIKEVNKNG